MTAWQGSHSHGFPPKTRAAILRRDPVCRCQGCKHHRGRCYHHSTEADHITPVASGGTHDPSNGQGLCSPCHQTKSSSEGVTAAQAKRSSRPRPLEPHPGTQGG